MNTLAWTLRNVVIPLLPFGIGALGRVLYSGQFEMQSLDPAELSFSMAMLTLIVSSSTSKLTDPALRNSISLVFYSGAVLFLVLFAWSIFLQTDVEAATQQLRNVAEQAARTGKVLPVSEFTPRIRDYETILDRLRVAAMILTVVTVPAALYCNKKYKLEDI